MQQATKGKVYIVGAGPGDPELITVRGQRLLREADLVLYAGSLVNPALLEYARPGVPCHDTASLTLEESIALIRQGASCGQVVVRLHTGDPALYGAIQEQIDCLEGEGIPWEIVPGVSSFLAAAAALGRELTVPGGSQTVILTRQGGRTPVPEAESLRELSRHRSTTCLFLSAQLLPQAVADLLVHFPPETPAAIVERASWPEQQTILAPLQDLPERAREAGITRTALVFVGDFLAASGQRSLLYDPAFSHGCRHGRDGEAGGGEAAMNRPEPEGQEHGHPQQECPQPQEHLQEHLQEHGRSQQECPQQECPQQECPQQECPQQECTQQHQQRSRNEHLQQQAGHRAEQETERPACGFPGRAERRLAVIYLTPGGGALAQRLEQAWLQAPYDGRLELHRADQPLWRQFGEIWGNCDGIVCVMAVGIVVRMVAPLLQSKWRDPGVVVVDEAGNFAVSLVGGHWGGANRLAREVASCLGAAPVVTTATDVRSKPAIDLLAKQWGFLPDPQERVKGVNSALLAGERVTIYSEWDLSGGLALDNPPPGAPQNSGVSSLDAPSPEAPSPDAPASSAPSPVAQPPGTQPTVAQPTVAQPPEAPPPGAPMDGSGAAGGLELVLCSSPQQLEQGAAADRGMPPVLVTSRTIALSPGGLCLRPPSLAAGIGCRRGVEAPEIVAALEEALSVAGRSRSSLALLASHEIKEDEGGLLEAAFRLGLPLKFFSSGSLEQVFKNSPGLQHSDYVQQRLGVGGVCEPAALAAVMSGVLVLAKTKFDRVTVALAEAGWLWSASGLAIRRI